MKSHQPNRKADYLLQLQRQESSGFGRGEVQPMHTNQLLIRLLLIAILLCFLFSKSEDLWAASVPPGFTETVIPGPAGGSWNEALGITFDNTGRMFIWERGGRVWIKDP